MQDQQVPIFDDHSQIHLQVYHYLQVAHKETLSDALFLL